MGKYRGAAHAAAHARRTQVARPDPAQRIKLADAYDRRLAREQTAHALRCQAEAAEFSLKTGVHHVPCLGPGCENGKIVTECDCQGRDYEFSVCRVCNDTGTLRLYDCPLCDSGYMTIDAAVEWTLLTKD